MGAGEVLRLLIYSHPLSLDSGPRTGAAWPGLRGAWGSSAAGWSQGKEVVTELCRGDVRRALSSLVILSSGWVVMDAEMTSSIGFLNFQLPSFFLKKVTVEGEGCV